MGVLTSMTLNGGVQKAGEILRDYVGGNSPTTTPTLTPTISPSSVPTRSNTIAPTKAPACKSWCKDNTLSWSQKCTWAKCSLCEPCGTSSPTASPTKNPTSLPPTSFPTANPTTTPTSSPVSGSEFCCSWNLYNCGVDSFCNLSEDNCQGSCGGTWMKKDSEAMSCLGKREACTNKEDACCAGSAACKGSDTYKQCVDIE